MFIADLYVPVTQVPEVEVGPSNALQFHRDFVSWNRPVVFRGAIKHWEAFKKWNRQYLTYDLSTYDR